MHVFAYIAITIQWLQACLHVISAQVYVCGVICLAPLGTTGTTLNRVLSVARGGGVSQVAKITIMVTIQHGCVQFTGTERTQLSSAYPHMAKGGKVYTGGQGENGGSNTVCREFPTGTVRILTGGT